MMIEDDDLDQALAREFALAGLRYTDPEEVYRKLSDNLSKIGRPPLSKTEIEARDKAEKRRRAAYSNLKKHPGIMAIKEDLENRWPRKFCIDDVLSRMIDAYWLLKEQQQRQPKRK